MIAQDMIRVKVAEDGSPVTGFFGLVALSRHAKETDLFGNTERLLGWVKERRLGRLVSLILFDLMMLLCASGC